MFLENAKTILVFGRPHAVIVSRRILAGAAALIETEVVASYLMIWPWSSLDSKGHKLDCLVE